VACGTFFVHGQWIFYRVSDDNVKCIVQSEIERSSMYLASMRGLLVYSSDLRDILTFVSNTSRISNWFVVPWGFGYGSTPLIDADRQINRC